MASSACRVEGGRCRDCSLGVDGRGCQRRAQQQLCLGFNQAHAVCAAPSNPTCSCPPHEVTRERSVRTALLRLPPGASQHALLALASHCVPTAGEALSLLNVPIAGAPTAAVAILDTDSDTHSPAAAGAATWPGQGAPATPPPATAAAPPAAAATASMVAGADGILLLASGLALECALGPSSEAGSGRGRGSGAAGIEQLLAGLPAGATADLDARYAVQAQHSVAQLSKVPAANGQWKSSARSSPTCTHMFIMCLGHATFMLHTPCQTLLSSCALPGGWKSGFHRAAF